MLVECTVHTGGARLITTRLLASPVQSLRLSCEGSGFFSLVSVFFSFDLSNFSISAISGLSDMAAEEAERVASQQSKVCSVVAAECRAGRGGRRYMRAPL